MRFEELHLIQPLMRAVKDQGYTEPTPIQQQAIPHILTGSDLIGLAQTGTGKTASFALPVLQRLDENTPKGQPRPKRARVLVLAPTRELAAQIDDSFHAYGKYLKFKHMTIFGGVSQNPQVAKFERGIEIVVATPGRLLDLMNQGHVSMDKLEVLVLDEADRMLDMGFLPDIKRILAKLPPRRQTLLFSATMPPDIQALANEMLVDPVKVEVAPESTTVEAIEQSVYFVEKSDKRHLLTHLLDERNMHRTLVFTRTKHGANRLAGQLSKAKFPAAAIHGNKSQTARQNALDDFKKGKTHVLVATDIAARGIDVDDISHVVNFDLPNETESYVHRIGRTGRAGADGIAISFCAVDERKYLRDIERLIQTHIPRVADHPYASAEGLPEVTDLNNGRRSSNGGGRSNGNGNGRGGNHRGKGGKGGSKNRNRNRNRNRSNSGESGGNGNGNKSRNRRRKPTPQ